MHARLIARFSPTPNPGLSCKCPMSNVHDPLLLSLHWWGPDAVIIHNCHGLQISHRCSGEVISIFFFLDTAMTVASVFLFHELLKVQCLAVFLVLPRFLPSSRSSNSLLKLLNCMCRKHTPVRPLRQCLLSSMQDQSIESYQTPV